MNARTGILGVVVVVVAVALLIVLRGDDGGGEETTSTGGSAPAGETGGGAKPGKESGSKSKSKATGPGVLRIVIDENGEPVGGVADLTVDKGEEVHFEVQSAVADEIHVHGHDLMQEVAAGGSVGFAFKANIEGIFEAELEERAEQILELKVEP
jgi:hypothetical protein